MDSVETLPCRSVTAPDPVIETTFERVLTVADRSVNAVPDTKELDKAMTESDSATPPMTADNGTESKENADVGIGPKPAYVVVEMSC